MLNNTPPPVTTLLPRLGRVGLSESPPARRHRRFTRHGLAGYRPAVHPADGTGVVTHLRVRAIDSTLWVAVMIDKPSGNGAFDLGAGFPSDWKPYTSLPSGRNLPLAPSSTGPLGWVFGGSGNIRLETAASSIWGIFSLPLRAHPTTEWGTPVP